MAQLFTVGGISALDQVINDYSGVKDKNFSVDLIIQVNMCNLEPDPKCYIRIRERTDIKQSKRRLSIY